MVRIKHGKEYFYTISFPCLTTTAPNDYGPLEGYPLVFQTGDAINSTACVDVDIIDDEVVELVETFSVSLDSDDPVIIDPIQEATISIIDNDSKSSYRLFIHVI